MEQSHSGPQEYAERARFHGFNSERAGFASQETLRGSRGVSCHEKPRGQAFAPVVEPDAHASLADEVKVHEYLALGQQHGFAPDIMRGQLFIRQ